MLGRSSARLGLPTAAVVILALLTPTPSASSAPDRDPTVRVGEGGTVSYRDPAAGEETRRLRGTLTTIVVDSRDGAHDVEYAVETRDGTLVPIGVRGELPQSVAGGDATVGLTKGGDLVAATIEPAEVDRALATAAHRAYVAKVLNDGPYAATDATIAAGIDQSLARWVVESDREISSFARVGGFRTYDPTGSCDDGVNLWNQAATLFPGVSFGAGTGNHLVVVAPEDCVFGLGTLGNSLADGGRIAVSYDPSSYYGALMHEFGHNVGLEHAHRIECDPSCQTVEYGNNYNFMGTTWEGSAPTGLDSAQRTQLGIVDTCEAPALSLAPGQRTVSATFDVFGRGTDSGTRGLRFVDPRDGATYAADWRNRVGRDTGSFYGTWYAVDSPDLPHVYDLGLTVERVSANGKDVSILGSVATDPPDGQAFSRKVGETFTVGDASVAVNSADGTGVAQSAQVTVTLTDTDVINPPPLPAQTGTATISGQTQVGGTVQALPVSWTAGACFRYQWFANGSPIAGARRSTFAIPASLVGQQLTVRVTGQRTGSAPRVATSPARLVTGSPVFTRTDPPRITGTARVGGALTAVPGAWEPAPAAWSYQWLANGRPLAGATARTLRLVPAQLGTRPSVRVTGSRPGFQPVTETSAATAPVAAVPFARTVAPKIKGTTKVGKVLRVLAGAWSPQPAAWRYQWLANGKPVAGAKGKKATLRLTRALDRKRISVRVTGIRPGYVTTARTSARTRPVR